MIKRLIKDMKIHSINNVNASNPLLKRKAKIVLFILFMLVPLSGLSQKIAVKTNALNWATISPNISAEFVVNPYMSLDLSASFNLWTPYADSKFNHLSLQPELRYWFQRPMAQHFLGFTLLYLDYDLMHKKEYHDGQAFGGGFTYGYNFVLTKRWNLELTAGIGVMHRWEKKYIEGEPLPVMNNANRWCLVPIKLGVTVSYVIF